MINICFSARSGYDKFSSNLFRELKLASNEIRAIFLAHDKYEADFVRTQFPDSTVYDVASYMEDVWETVNEETLNKFEEKYNCSPIWKYIYTDRFLVDRDHSYCVKTTAGLFQLVEHIFLKEKIDIYYDETIATLQSYVCQIVGSKQKILYISQMVARGFDSTHHYFLMDPFQLQVPCFSEEELSQEVRMQASTFLKHFETNLPSPFNMRYTGKYPKFKLRFFGLPLSWFIKRFSEKYNNKFAYIYYQRYKTALNPIVFWLRYHLSKKYYHTPALDRKFVYFPLHYQPEASTIVCAQKYEKQLFYIDSWAKSLPADTVLYVKEHYALLGNRKIAFYKELKKYPNVILIDPLVDTFSLIQNSVAVTTLTGTAGWEAMLLRKPVFLGGRIFYENAPGVIRVDDIYGNYLRLMEQYRRPTREEVIEYLASYMQSIRPGNVYAASPKCYEDDNMSKVAESLLEFIKFKFSNRFDLQDDVE